VSARTCPLDWDRMTSSSCEKELGRDSLSQSTHESRLGSEINPNINQNKLYTYDPGAHEFSRQFKCSKIYRATCRWNSKNARKNLLDSATSLNVSERYFGAWRKKVVGYPHLSWTLHQKRLWFFTRLLRNPEYITFDIILCKDGRTTLEAILIIHSDKLSMCSFNLFKIESKNNVGIIYIYNNTLLNCV